MMHYSPNVIQNSLLLDDVQTDELYRNWLQTLDTDATHNVFPQTEVVLEEFAASIDPMTENNVDNENTSPLLSNSTEVTKKRKKQETKTNCETKRRTKIIAHFDVLESLLQDRQAHNIRPKMTREKLLGSAVNEIMKLRQQLSQMQQQKNTPQQQCQLSLSDPFNREPYTNQDLERAFEVLFVRETLDHFREAKSTDKLLHGIKSLEDVSKQIGKAKYRISAGLLEQLFNFGFRFHPKELSACLTRNWKTYLEMEKSHGESIGLYLNMDAGPWILADMSLVEYVTGNLNASETYYQQAKLLTKKIAHPGTIYNFLGLFVWNYRCTLSISVAEQIWAILSESPEWSVVGAVILGTSLIAHGQSTKGIAIMEYSFLQKAHVKDFSSICFLPFSSMLEAYVQARQVDKGLALATELCTKFDVLAMETVFGHGELLRQKANLLMMKRYPEFIPEIHGAAVEDPSIQEMIDLLPIPPKQIKPTLVGPFHLPEGFHSNTTESENIETLLRSALSFAHCRGACTIELRCAVDLIRYFLHIGDVKQAVDTVQTVKDCISRIRGPVDAREFQKARYIISLVEAVLE